MNNDTLDSLENLFLALSDKTRLRLMGLMSGGEVSVGYLADALGESQPKISRHLAYLRNAGLVATRRDGKWIYYGIDEPTDAAAVRVLRETLHSLDPGTAIFHERGSEPDRARDEAEHDHWEPEEMPIYLL